ncbi:MAG: type II toxin-antitoxin system VapC family toxin [Candidatus Eremiobacteraeota bacterium]|nr:type II toxin-antitoxin system VapC family toxin [Candidatus Eremiobacteraeota bacterium]
MRALLDTNAWLWFTGRSERLGPRTRALLVDPKNELFLSIASAWEIAIKAGLGKIAGIGEPSAFVKTRLRRQSIVPLAITLDHVLAVAALPHLHRDPFDRLLVAQAQAESLIIVTADSRLSQYDVSIQDATL